MAQHGVEAKVDKSMRDCQLQTHIEDRKTTELIITLFEDINPATVQDKIISHEPLLPPRSGGYSLAQRLSQLFQSHHIKI